MATALVRVGTLRPLPAKDYAVGGSRRRHSDAAMTDAMRTARAAPNTMPQIEPPTHAYFNIPPKSDGAPMNGAAVKAGTQGGKPHREHTAETP